MRFNLDVSWIFSPLSRQKQSCNDVRAITRSHACQSTRPSPISLSFSLPTQIATTMKATTKSANAKTTKVPKEGTSVHIFEGEGRTFRCDLLTQKSPNVAWPLIRNMFLNKWSPGLTKIINKILWSIWSCGVLELMWKYFLAHIMLFIPIWRFSVGLAVAKDQSSKDKISPQLGQHEVITMVWLYGSSINLPKSQGL